MRLLYTLRKRKEQHKAGYQGSVPELLQDADGIKEVIFTNGYHSVCPISKTQRELLQMFGLQTPVSRYETGTVFANMIRYARKPHGEQDKTRF